MSMLAEVRSWQYNEKADRVEIVVGIGDTQKTVILSLTMLGEMTEVLPSFEEEKMIKDLLKLIAEVTKRRVLRIEKLDEMLEELRAGHADARKALGNAREKLDVMMHTSIIKSLAAEKVVIAEKRHLIKLLLADESDLRAKLARIRAGRR